jgi:hypothetical protein
MLQQSTNPPQIIPRRADGATDDKTVGSLPPAFSVIDASMAPIKPDFGIDLLDELCCMKDEHDICGMMGLYEFYAAAAEISLAASNSPLIANRAYDRIQFEGEQAWAKAYLVADFLTKMRPNRYDVERYSTIMFDITLQMGNNFSDAVAVVNEIATWDLRQPGVDD